MRKQGIKFLSGIMLLVFMAGTAPKEYLHELFYHHHDTVDQVLKKGEVVIGKKHIHCAFLSFQFGHFIKTERQVLLFEHLVHFTIYQVPVYRYHYSNTHKVVSLRGPPAIC